jgi:hypothetical protein
MSLEQQIAELTTATTSLLEAVNLRKSVLDAAAENASESAAAAATSEGSAADSAVVANAAAQTAANAVFAELTAIKAQTETARDQALAGLGAADNSQVLSELLGAVAYATDLAGQAVREGVRIESSLTTRASAVETNVATYDSAITAAILALQHVLDLAGVTARAVSGGDIILRSGSVLPPPVSPAGDRDTGMLFPAADTLAIATNALERLRVTADGRVGIGTTAPSGLLDIADDKVRVRSPKTPASATAAGNAGEIAWDANYVYVCVATDAWRRAALTTW